MAEPNNTNVASNPGNTTQPGQTTGQQPQQQSQAGNDPNAGGQRQQQTGTQQDKVFTYKEDRTDWIPPHRLSKVTHERTEIERERDQLRQDLEQERRRIAALAGVKPQDPQEKELAELSGIIRKMFPKLGLLDNLDEETLAEVIDAAQVARQSSSSLWDKHTRDMLTKLDTEAAKVLGIEKLDEKVATRVQRAFNNEGQAALAVRKQDVQRGLRDTLETLPTDNDFIARYERGDGALVTEFVTDYLNGFIEPVRRSVTADITRRGMRPVPRGERTRTPIVTGEQKEDLNTPDGFKKALLAARGSGASNT